MRAVFRRESLLAACKQVASVVPTRDVKPILQNIKAIAADGRCSLMATDLEVGVRLDVGGVAIEELGEGIWPASKLVAILRESRDSELLIETTTEACIVRGASAEFEMPSEDAAQFPSLPDFDGGHFCEMPAGALREMARRTVFATADDATRYSMTGVLWEMDGESLSLVATDGRRLALSLGILIGGDPATIRGLVPTKAMALLDRVFDDDAQSVSVCLRANDVLFQTQRATVYSRLVEGRFPDYKAVLPKKPGTRIALQSGPFQAAIRQAAVMADDDSKRVVFGFGANKLTLKAQGAHVGRSRVELPIEYSGKALEIALNPVYLLDMLKALSPDAELTLEVLDKESPVMLRSGESYSYLVMPLS